MQSIQKKQKTKKQIALIVLLLALVASSAIAYAYLYGPLKQDGTSYTESSKNDKPQSNEELGVSEPKPGDPTSDSAKSNPTMPPSASGTIEITQTNVLDDTFIVRTIISEITDSGTCTLIMNNGSQTYSASADVQAAASSSTCKGFNVPLDKLSTGKWTVKVKYEKLDGSAISATTEANI